MKGGVKSLLEAVVLLDIGLGSLLFAFHADYARLMNPAFRNITIGGAILVLFMGLTLLVRPRKGGTWGALIVFGVLFAVVALGRPFAPGVAPTIPSARATQALTREGYDPLLAESLFRTIQEEEAEVAAGTYMFGGLVYRTEANDAEGVFILLEPVMACCLADAIALGLRIHTTGPLPEPQTWVYAFGTLRRLSEPVETPRFRLGAIMFTNVSRNYAIDADEVVPYRSLLPDVVEMIPRDQSRIFRDAVEATGLAEELRGDGPYTVFVPLDLLFEQLPAADRTALFAPEARRRLRTLLEDYVVRGTHYEADLYDLDALTTLSGRTLTLEAKNGNVHVEGARILFGDQGARNGVVHLVHPGWLPK